MAESIKIKGDQLAYLLDVHPRTVRKLAEDGLVIKADRGQYLLAESLRRYCKHMRDIAENKTGRDGQLDNIAEGALLKKAQRELAEAQLAKVQGRLIPEADVRDAWGVVIKAIRAVVLAWPNRAQAELPHLTGEDVDALKTMTAGLLKHNALAAADDRGPPVEAGRKGADAEE